MAIDVNEFTSYALEKFAFYYGVLAELSKSRQDFLIVDYNDLQTKGTQDDIAKFLGSEFEIDESKIDIIKQNSQSLDDRVTNLHQIIDTLQSLKIARWIV
jgi:hypothetical protein